MDSPRPRPAARLWHWLAVPAGLVLLMTGYFTLPLDKLGPHRPVLSWIVFGSALTILAALMLRQIWHVMTASDQGRPGIRILLLIELSLVIFASGYLDLARQPGAFANLHTRVDSLYFTVVTLATVGYGDITASGQTARVVVLVQILYNFVFLTAGASAISRQLRGKLTVRLRDHATPPPEREGDVGPTG